MSDTAARGRRAPFTILPNAALDLDPVAFKLYVLLLSYTDGASGSAAWPSNATLGKRLRPSKPASTATVQRALAALDDAGLIERQLDRSDPTGCRRVMVVHHPDWRRRTNEGSDPSPVRGQTPHQRGIELDPSELHPDEVPPYPPKGEVGGQPEPTHSEPELGDRLAQVYPHPSYGGRAARVPSGQQVETWLVQLRSRNPLLRGAPLPVREILAGAEREAARARANPDERRRQLKTWLQDLGWQEQLEQGAAEPLENPDFARERARREVMDGWPEWLDRDEFEFRSALLKRAARDGWQAWVTNCGHAGEPWRPWLDLPTPPAWIAREVAKQRRRLVEAGLAADDMDRIEALWRLTA